MNKKLEVLKFLSSSGMVVVGQSKSKDLSWKDYLIFSSTGTFSVYTLEFSADDVESISIDQDVVICVK